MAETNEGEIGFLCFLFKFGESQVYEFPVIFFLLVILNMKLKINILSIVNFSKLMCESGSQASNNTHFCGRVVDEVIGKRLLSVKICSIGVKSCGQSGNGNRSSRRKGMI